MQLARWKDLEKELSQFDWSQLKRGTAEDALKYFMELLWLILSKHIPYKALHLKKKSHPWLDARCETAIDRKSTSEGTEAFASEQRECSKVMAEAYQEHVQKLRAKIATLKRGSKQWWSLNRELLNKKAKISSIPPLRDGPTWLADPK